MKPRTRAQQRQAEESARYLAGRAIYPKMADRYWQECVRCQDLIRYRMSVYDGERRLWHSTCARDLLSRIDPETLLARGRKTLKAKPPSRPSQAKRDASTKARRWKRTLRVARAQIAVERGQPRPKIKACGAEKIPQPPPPGGWFADLEAARARAMAKLRPQLDAKNAKRRKKPAAEAGAAAPGQP